MSRHHNYPRCVFSLPFPMAFFEGRCPPTSRHSAFSTSFPPYLWSTPAQTLPFRTEPFRSRLHVPHHDNKPASDTVHWASALPKIRPRKWWYPSFSIISATGSFVSSAELPDLSVLSEPGVVVSFLATYDEWCALCSAGVYWHRRALRCHSVLRGCW